MQWNNLTVRQFQGLSEIAQQPFDHEIERSCALLASLDGLPVEHYEGMPLDELKAQLPRLAFLHTGEIPAVPTPKFIKAGGRTYRVVYDFQALTAGQFIDVITATREASDQVRNLHLTMAALCVPTKWRLGRRVTLEYGAEPYTEVAERMLDASLLEVQAVGNFFFQLWQDFLTSMPGFLKKKMETMDQNDRDRWEAALRAAGVGL